MLMDSIPTLPPCTTSILWNSSLISLTTASFLVAVFAVVNDFCLEGFCNLKQFCFIFPGAVENLDVENFFHSDKYICEVDYLDNLDHAV